MIAASQRQYGRALLEQAMREQKRRRQNAPTQVSALEWVSEHATIVHPSRGRICFTPYPYQAAFLTSHDAPRRLILKARQIGFSQVFALEALYDAITTPESTILLVSRSQDLAVNLLRYCYLTYNNLDEAPDLRKANEGEMGFANGSRIKSIPANRSTGRGFAATSVYLDEFAYADYAEDIYQSVSPTVSQGGRLTIGSTPNGEQNLFARLFGEANDFEKMVCPWWQCPAYWTADEQAAGIPKEQAAWYLTERPKYTDQQWASEYDCDFVVSAPERFLPTMLWWDACRVDSEPLHPAFREPLVVAVDAGVTSDAFAVVAVGRHPTIPDGVAVRHVQSWVPARNEPLDFDTIEAAIRQFCTQFNVVQIAYDPYQLHQMMSRLDAQGVAWCVPFGQGAERLVADKNLLDLIMQQRLAHDGNQTLRTHIENADRRVGDDRGQLRLVKRSAGLKIDCAVALSMAAARATSLLGAHEAWASDPLLAGWRG